MKTRLAHFGTRVVLLLALCGFSLTAQAEDAGPAQVIRDFYKWYVGELIAEHDPFEEGRKEVERFISERWIKEIDAMRAGPDGLDADPFLSAQDFDKEWATNVTVVEPVIEGDRATAEVELKGGQLGSQKLQVSLVQENGGWKIDAVEGK
ncbi:MAG: DUF3828 domain-containing protein [Chthoniobacterales bacterium]